MNDLISRQEAIDAADKIIERDTSGNNDVVKAMTAWKMYVESLTSAQPERKKGKWIWKTGDVYKCSECETETHVDECFEEPIYNYCPYCNAVMDGYER